MTEPNTAQSERSIVDQLRAIDWVQFSKEAVSSLRAIIHYVTLAVLVVTNMIVVQALNASGALPTEPASVLLRILAALFWAITAILVAQVAMNVVDEYRATEAATAEVRGETEEVGTE